MSFKITINEVKQIEVEEQPAMCAVEEILVTQKEIDEADYHDKKEMDKKIKDGNLFKRKYGYPAKVKTIKLIDNKVFEQVVDTLDLKAVISAINK